MSRRRSTVPPWDSGTPAGHSKFYPISKLIAPLLSLNLVDCCQHTSRKNAEENIRIKNVKGHLYYLAVNSEGTRTSDGDTLVYPSGRAYCINMIIIILYNP